MDGITSMHYADNLPTLLERKRTLGHYANPMMEAEGVYEADQGWDTLFTDYLAARAEHAPLKRAGATAKDKVLNIAKKIKQQDLEDQAAIDAKRESSHPES